MSTPVLDTIRALLQFRDSCSIAEISSTAGIPKKQVLDAINFNGRFVFRNRKTGRVTKVDIKSQVTKEAWASGQYWRKGSWGAWSHEGDSIEFDGHPELRAALEREQITGGLGDSYYVKVIHFTPENVAVVELAGLRPWSEFTPTEDAWKE